MRFLLAAAAIGIAALASPALADDEYDSCTAKGETDADYRDCGHAWLERADAALNAAWHDLRETSSEETLKWLLDEQRAWNAYKEKSCVFWASGEYGTIGSIFNYTSCRAEVIEARTEALRGYREGLQEQ